MEPDWSSKEWLTAPLIVTENAVKDAFNQRATEAYAERTGQTLHYYYAADIHRGKIIGDGDLRTHLQNLTSGTTSQRLGMLPLVIGMPVMITQNFDVEGGVVNGATGTLEQIRYRLDEDGRRIALSCVVNVPLMTLSPLTGLKKCQAVTLQDPVRFGI